jgi:t-SNARE complex subunit (syntaxin)
VRLKQNQPNRQNRRRTSPDQNNSTQREHVLVAFDCKKRNSARSPSATCRSNGDGSATAVCHRRRRRRRRRVTSSSSIVIIVIVIVIVVVVVHQSFEK